MLHLQLCNTNTIVQHESICIYFIMILYMMKLVLSTKLTKHKIPNQSVNHSGKSPVKNIPSKLIHPVNSVLLDVITKKPLKSCGCGK